MREFREPTASQSRFAASRRQTSLADGEGVVDLAEVQASEVPRILTGIGEFDRVTGGGLVPGGVGLIGGDPGIGKSTLLLQVLARMVRLGKTALYVSGEESASQVALRAQRIGLDPSGMRLMSEIELRLRFPPPNRSLLSSTPFKRSTVRIWNRLRAALRRFGNVRLD